MLWVDIFLEKANNKSKPLIMKTVTRRKFLQLSGGALGALTLTSCGSHMGNMNDDGNILQSADIVSTASPSSTGAVPTATLTSHSPVPSANFTPDVDLTLRATVSEQSILAGPATKLLRYVGELHQGDPSVLTDVPNSYLGPTIRVRRGQKVRVTLVNELSSETIIHWHGQHLPEAMDGHPRFVVQPNEQYVYEFTVQNRAGTYWYHPHPHQQTGGQSYYGLAGLLIIHDEEEEQFALPQGEFDVPLVIQDRTFDDDNQLKYVDNGHQIMAGFFAETLLINGRVNTTQEVATRAYRLRLLNASNARTYKLAWSDGSPITVIATDGGLLAAPIMRDYVMLGSAERLDLWADFSQEAVGSERTLVALPFENGNLSAAKDIYRFSVQRDEKETLTLPTSFAPLALRNAADAHNVKDPRVFNFFVNHMTPTVDGRGFDLNDADKNETVTLNALEVWELTNDVNGANGFPHPIHVHGLQFQVIERTGTPSDVRDGYVDEGWKDTVLLMPNERAKILLKFEDYTGLFLYHCHNLEHEDGGMMRNYRVVAAA